MAGSKPSIALRYLAVLDGEPGAFGATFPDLPGVTAMGSTREAAIANAVEACSRLWMRRRRGSV
jgi:hypothetical protein